MSKQLVNRACLLVLMLFGINVSAQTGSSLEGISYSALPGDRVQVRLDLDTPQTSEPLNFTIDNPARIALISPTLR